MHALTVVIIQLHCVKNLVNFSLVISEITTVECAIFAANRPQVADPTFIRHIDVSK